ncbi:MAG TPA: FCD domain-containing protein [Baekduia sp.]|nr:FCD domain-containing protein [Baekduia sp.]
MEHSTAPGGHRDRLDARISRAEALARQIEEHIRDEALPQGWRLGTKTELRDRFGVAVGTVNEAIRVLATRGLVEARPGPGGGLFVATPSPHIRLSHLILGFREGGTTIADCLAVRNALEPLVAEDARRCHTEEDVAELRGILARMAESLDSPARFLEANWALHRRLVAISPNAVLRAVYTTLMDFIETSVEDVAPDEVFRGRANLRVHEGLVEAIASGDPRQVARAVGRHSPHAEWISATLGEPRS